MIESYLVLARKYRPQMFKDVVHQEIPINALKNAINHNRVGHAYIFFGPRGVGKTTIARILAKRLNCQNPQGEEPCNICKSCVEITKGISNNVIEIDAASNRGIDDIRELRESVKFNPMGGDYRVYIIDEVHMLTMQAFNALLKTLEEPPRHVVFILATTDYHKIPETILSRCQDFTFKKVPTLVLQDYIEKIAKIERFNYDSEGLFWIAKKGDGSVRDTLSFMEQAVTFTNGNLTGKQIIKIIGYSGIELQIELLHSLLKEKHPIKVFQTIESLYSEGGDLQRYIWEFVEFLHSSVLIRENIVDREALNYPLEDIQKIQKQIFNYSPDLLVFLSEKVYEIFEKLTMLRLRNSYEVKVFLEINFQKLIRQLNQPSLSGILEKISQLNEQVKQSFIQISEEKTQTSSTTPETQNTSSIVDLETSLKEKFSGSEIDPNTIPKI